MVIEVIRIQKYLFIQAEYPGGLPHPDHQLPRRSSLSQLHHVHHLQVDGWMDGWVAGCLGGGVEDEWVDNNSIYIALFPLLKALYML